MKNVMGGLVLALTFGTVACYPGPDSSADSTDSDSSDNSASGSGGMVSTPDVDPMPPSGEAGAGGTGTNVDPTGTGGTGGTDSEPDPVETNGPADLTDLCQRSCAADAACDAALDSNECTRSCMQVLNEYGFEYGQQYIETFLTCYESADCKNRLASTDRCGDETLAVLPVTAVVSETCQALNGPATKCHGFDNVACLTYSKIYSDPALREAQECAALSCELLSDCVNVALGFESGALSIGIREASGDNSCDYAYDGYCDESDLCDYGTDSYDCGY